MLPNLFAGTSIPALGEVLNFAQARHTVLAGNIANVNTPGYRLRDLNEAEFQQRLKEAVTQTASHDARSTSLVAAEPGDPMRDVRQSLENLIYQLCFDGNDGPVSAIRDGD
jgi:flagellar basal-body rod protein FlgB